MKLTSTSASIGLLVMTAIWGITFPLVNMAMETYTPLWFVAIRFVIAAICIAFVAFATGNTKLVNPKSALICGVLLFLGFVSQTAGIAFSTATRAAFITGLSVVLVPTIEFLFFRKRFGAKLLCGLGLSILGLAFLTLNKVTHTASTLAPSDLFLGDCLLFLCALSFASFIIAVTHYGKTENVYALAAWQILMVALMSLPVALAFEPWQLPSVLVWAILAFLALVATALTTVVQISFQQHITATQAALIFAMEPVFATLFAWILQGEKLSNTSLIGSVAMLIGAIIASLPGQEESLPEPNS